MKWACSHQVGCDVSHEAASVSSKEPSVVALVDEPPLVRAALMGVNLRPVGSSRGGGEARDVDGTKSVQVDEAQDWRHSGRTRGNQAITGTVTRGEADGFWIGSPDGIAYRSLPSSEPAGEVSSPEES